MSTAKRNRLVQWVESCESGMLLESQVVAAGMSSALNAELLPDGRLDMKPHPTVKDRKSGMPVMAVVMRGKEAR